MRRESSMLTIPTLFSMYVMAFTSVCRNLPGQSLIVLSSAFSSQRRPNVCGTLPTLRQCPLYRLPHRGQKVCASLPAPKAVQLSAHVRETGKEWLLARVQAA